MSEALYMISYNDCVFISLNKFLNWSRKRLYEYRKGRVCSFLRRWDRLLL